MHNIFSEENAEAVFLINAENLFNSINQKVMLHIIQVLCLLVSTYICYCHATPERLFISGRDEILSKEEATRGDLTSMGAYAFGILPMLYSLLDFTLTNDHQTREFAFADDHAVAEKLADIKNFWVKLATIGSKYGHFPKSTKSYLLRTMFPDTNINITTDERKHLGAAIGSEIYKVQYTKDLVDDWNRQPSSIAEINPR